MQHEHNGSVAAAAAVVAFTDLESVDCVKIVAFGVVGGDDNARMLCVDHTQATMTTFTSEENETDERRRRTRNLT